MNQAENRMMETLLLQEERLSLRLEDLEGRLQDLTEHFPPERKSPAYDRLFCSEMADCELDNAIPSDMKTIQDVLTAIRRTKDFLWNVQCEQKALLQAETEKQKEVPGQIVFIGFADAFAQRPALLAS